MSSSGILHAFKISCRLNVHCVCPLGVDALVVHRRGALVRRTVVNAFPCVLVTSTDSTQAEPVIRGIATLGAARADTSSDDRGVALGGGSGAAVTTTREEMAQRGDTAGEATDTGLDIGAEDDVSDPEREIGLRLELVDEGNSDHGDDGRPGFVSLSPYEIRNWHLQRSEGEKSESLELGLFLHLCVPQDDRGHDDQGQIGQDSRDCCSVCDDEESLRRSAFSLAAHEQ
jgi:hypothetical protein